MATALLLAAAGCQPHSPTYETFVPATVMEPAYQFTVGANLYDVLGALGHPASGPRFDAYSRTREVVFAFDQPVIAAETPMPNGVVRTEMLQRITMFFDGNDLLVQMTGHPHRHYSWFSGMPVTRITVQPRLRRTLTQ